MLNFGEKFTVDKFTCEVISIHTWAFVNMKVNLTEMRCASAPLLKAKY